MDLTAPTRAERGGPAGGTTSRHRAWARAPEDGTVHRRSADVCAQVSLTCQVGRLGKTPKPEPGLDGGLLQSAGPEPRTPQDTRLCDARSE